MFLAVGIVRHGDPPQLGSLEVWPVFRQVCNVALVAIPILGSLSVLTATEPKPADGPKQITSSIGMKLTLVPSGEFMMGNSLTAAEEIVQFKKYGVDLNADCFKMEYPRHRVRITRPFYLGTYHVTRGQFRQFVNDTGYKTDAERGQEPGANGLDVEKGTFFEFHEKRSWRNVAFEQTDSHPVVNVSSQLLT